MKIAIFWFRRDLRLEDNAGLYQALKGADPVLPVFIFDTGILEKLEEKTDRRVRFIYEQVTLLHKQLQQWGSTLYILHGTPQEAFKKLLKEYEISCVYTNRDYEPYARQRDEAISDLLAAKGAVLKTFKDQVIFEQQEVVKDNKEPYTVFTPFSKKWKAQLQAFYLKPYPTLKYKNNFYQRETTSIPALQTLGFSAAAEPFPPSYIPEELIRSYEETRDIPSITGTTRLGMHLRFGTISIRKLAAAALALNETFLNELIWREFFMMILWHFPRLVNTSFREEYDRIQWRNNEQEFERWCNGQTGYPIVDAGMRELNSTGFMHNRVRMITASFLAKNLLIDWRWGEAYFAKKLLDYDLAANNGNWQWAAGTGCDAAPYFRIFNPQKQMEKFDPQLTYTRHWVPELDTEAYPEPIVDYAASRERCLTVYKKALQQR